MRGRLILFALILPLAVCPPAGAGERLFHSLSVGYSTRHGIIYGMARSDSLAWAEVRTGILYGAGQTAIQIGLRRQLLTDVIAMVAISEPLPVISPHAARDFSRQLHGDIYWKGLLGLSLDGKGEQRQLSLNVWRIGIPIAGHIDGVPWVLY